MKKRKTWNGKSKFNFRRMESCRANLSKKKLKKRYWLTAMYIVNIWSDNFCCKKTKILKFPVECCPLWPTKDQLIQVQVQFLRVILLLSKPFAWYHGNKDFLYNKDISSRPLIVLWDNIFEQSLCQYSNSSGSIAKSTVKWSFVTHLI